MRTLEDIQDATAIVQDELTEQIQEYERQRSDLDEAIARFNTYILENEMLRQALEKHCMSNENIAKNILHNTEIDRVLATVKIELEKVDRLLNQARIEHDNKFLRQPIGF